MKLSRMIETFVYYGFSIKIEKCGLDNHLVNVEIKRPPLPNMADRYYKYNGLSAKEAIAKAYEEFTA